MAAPRWRLPSRVVQHAVARVVGAGVVARFVLVVVIGGRIARTSRIFAGIPAGGRATAIETTVVPLVGRRLAVAPWIGTLVGVSPGVVRLLVVLLPVRTPLVGLLVFARRLVGVGPARRLVPFLVRPAAPIRVLVTGGCRLALRLRRWTHRCG